MNNNQFRKFFVLIILTTIFVFGFLLISTEQANAYRETNCYWSKQVIGTTCSETWCFSGLVPKALAGEVYQGGYLCEECHDIEADVQVCEYREVVEEKQREPEDTSSSKHGILGYASDKTKTGIYDVTWKTGTSVSYTECIQDYACNGYQLSGPQLLFGKTLGDDPNAQYETGTYTRTEKKDCAWWGTRCDTSVEYTPIGGVRTIGGGGGRQSPGNGGGGAGDGNGWRCDDSCYSCGSYSECGTFCGYCPPSVSLSGPAVVEVPNGITLTWSSSNADSCSASGDWSGGKSTSGSQTIKSKTTTADRGTYDFTLSCSGPGGSASDSLSVKVIQVPYCIFSADPKIIILPQLSTLSWECVYADSCEIDQGIGSVNPISAFLNVRPKETTTYTLDCQGLDGSRQFQADVGVGFIPVWREVFPR